jgi:ribosomal protein S18 acetylase RimI-like enzyme
MDVECRILKAEDGLSYREARLESLKLDPECFGACYQDEVQIAELRFEKLIAQQSDQALMLGAFIGTPLVGLCGLLSSAVSSSMGSTLGSAIGSNAEPAKIVQMYVKAEYRGLGVSNQLLSLAKQCLSVLDNDSLLLTVFKSNQGAIKAYEKAGFIPTKVVGEENYMVFSL